MKNSFNLRIVLQSVSYFIAVTAILFLTRNSGFAQSAIAQTNVVEIWKLEAGPEYYYWQETGNGQKLLHESGPRYAVELSCKAPTQEKWLTTVRFKFYYGRVDYDGQTQGGVPLKTTTEYIGGLVDFGAGYRWTFSDERNLDLIGRFGIEDWQRNIGSAGGYGENWMPLYFKLGLESDSEKTTGWTGALGVKVPIYTYQNVDWTKFGAGTITLNPGTMPSGYAEIGYKFTQHLSLAAYFDSYWFSQSPNESNGKVVAFQPESKTFQAGLKAGWTF